MTADRPIPIAWQDARLVARLLKAHGMGGTIRGGRIVVELDGRRATIDLEDWVHRYWLADTERIEEVTRGTEWADAFADQVVGWLKTGVVTYPDLPKKR